MWLVRFLVCAFVLTTLVDSTALAGTPEQGARRLRDAGIGLTAAGGAVLATGAAFAIGGAASMSPCNDGQPDCNSAGAFVLVGGAGIGVLSIPFLAAGIPLWVIGDKRLDRANGTVLYVHPTRAGGVQFGLTGSF